MSTPDPIAIKTKPATTAQPGEASDDAEPPIRS